MNDTTQVVDLCALGDIPEEQSGVGSGINNAVARIAGLVAIAAVPLAAGFDTSSSTEELFTAYGTAQLICAGLCLTGMTDQPVI